MHITDLLGGGRSAVGQQVRSLKHPVAAMLLALAVRDAAEAGVSVRLATRAAPGISRVQAHRRSRV